MLECLALAKLLLIFLRHGNNFQVTAMKAGWGGKEAMGVERIETVNAALESSEQSHGSEGAGRPPGCFSAVMPTTALGVTVTPFYRQAGVTQVATCSKW